MELQNTYIQSSPHLHTQFSHLDLGFELYCMGVFSYWIALQVDLTGGYYDAGDNVKFGFPMAFTTTMLSWSVLEFGEFMGDDLDHAKTAIRWATDYLLKAVAHPGVLYVQVILLFL